MWEKFYKGVYKRYEEDSLWDAEYEDEDKRSGVVAGESGDENREGEIASFLF